MTVEAGSKAIGQAAYTSVGPASPRTMQLSLKNVYLKIGERNIPLRPAGQKGAAGPLDYHWIDDSGRIALVLYVAEKVTLPPSQ
jgi:hypothetical protein